MEPFDWQLAERLATELYAARTEMSEVGRVVEFMRKRINSGDDGGKDLDVFLERMSAGAAANFNAYPDAYRKITAAKQSLLGEVTDGKRLFVILDAALKNMRAFREVPSLVTLPEPEKPKEVAAPPPRPQQKSKEERAKLSPFAVLKSQAPQAVAVETRAQLKRGDRIVALVSAIDGTSITADYEGNEIRFDKPLYGEPNIGDRVEVQIQSQQSGFWRALFRRIK